MLAFLRSSKSPTEVIKEYNKIRKKDLVNNEANREKNVRFEVYF